MTLENSIVANNTATLPGGNNLRSGMAGMISGMFISLGHNLLESLDNAKFVGADPGTTGNETDYIGPIQTNYVVTSVVDEFNSADDDVNLTLRDAIDKANNSASDDEIWLPAWTFIITRERDPETVDDDDVDQGDLEITESLTIRGINGSTRVAWRAGTAADKLFELLGDYNADGSVDAADYVLWQEQEGEEGSNLAADGNDNGVVDDDDYDIWASHFGYWLSVINVPFPDALLVGGP